MPYNFRTRLPHVGSRMQEVNYEDVVYSNGTYSVAWRVTPTRPLQLEDRYGNPIMLSIHRKDFFGSTAGLLLNGTAYLPQRGDTITRANGEVYKVVSDAEDQTPYEYVTDVRDRIRVRTILTTGAS